MLRSRLVMLLAGCALVAPAAADVVVMRFQGRVNLLYDHLNVFDFPDTQRNVWGRITVDTDAPGTQYFPNGTYYQLVGIELYVRGRSFIADELRQLTIINDNNEPLADDVFRFDGFVAVSPEDHFSIESMTFGDANWLASQAIPDLGEVRMDHAAVNGAWVHLSRSIGFERSDLVADITRWDIVPAPPVLALGATVAFVRRRR